MTWVWTHLERCKSLSDECISVGPKVLHSFELLKIRLYAFKSYLFFNIGFRNKYIWSYSQNFIHTCSSHLSLANNSLRILVVSKLGTAFFRPSTTSKQMVCILCFWWCSRWNNAAKRPHFLQTEKFCVRKYIVKNMTT